MISWRNFAWCFALALLGQMSFAQATLRVPKSIEAGSGAKFETSGSGTATVYVVGPGQVLSRTVQLGQELTLAPEETQNAGHYTAFLGGSEHQAFDFDIVPVKKPTTVTFLAKPSRLPVDVTNGISGVTYLFDAFANLIVEPLPVSFQVQGSSGKGETKTVTTRYGVAWVRMNSATSAGAAQLEASAAGLSQKRVVQQVPGDPCNINMTAKAAKDDRVVLETAPVKDCRGNPVPDGTIVTFSETANGTQSTVDVPLK